MQGAKPVPLAISLAIGAMVQFLIPVPDGITRQAWSLLSLFITTIAGMLLKSRKSKSNSYQTPLERDCMREAQVHGDDKDRLLVSTLCECICKQCLMQPLQPCQRSAQVQHTAGNPFTCLTMYELYQLPGKARRHP